MSDTLHLSDRRERLLVRALQLALGALFVYALATFRAGLAVNSGLALAVTVLPAVVRREYGYDMDAGLVLWITAATILHAVGSLGLYSRFSWYDEVTHTVSAAFVAGVGYAVFRTLDRHSEEVDAPAEFRAVFVVVFVMAFGVVWEVFEFAAVQLSRTLGVQPPITVYGIDDIVTDFVFNTAGAVAVALWGTAYFDRFAAFLGRRFTSTSDE